MENPFIKLAKSELPDEEQGLVRTKELNPEERKARVVELLRLKKGIEEGTVNSDSPFEELDSIEDEIRRLEQQ